MIKYIGSKRALLGHVTGAVAGLLPAGGRVCDLFSGTARVGHALKRQGFQVWSNDHNAYAHTLATAYVQADRERWLAPAEAVLAELREVRPVAGWFTQAFCEDARYFHPDNGARIDAMRERIETLSLEPELKAVVLVSLMEAADRVDSTAGVQMAYMKRWAPRALKPLELRLPDLLPSVGAPCRATRGDAVEMAAEVEADLVYLDPPYIPTDHIAGLDPEVRDHDPHLALDGGPDGLQAYRDLAPEVMRILKPGGVFAVEIGWDQGPQVKALFEAEGFEDVKIVKDLGDRDRVVTNGPDPRTNPIPQE